MLLFRAICFMTLVEKRLTEPELLVETMGLSVGYFRSLGFQVAGATVSYAMMDQHGIRNKMQNKHDIRRETKATLHLWHGYKHSKFLQKFLEVPN